MSQLSTSLRVPGLTQAEAEDLAARLSGEAVSLEEEPVPPDVYGDIGTITAIVTVSLAAIQALSFWILTHRSTRSSRRSLEVTRPDGTTIKLEIEETDRSSAPPDAQIIQQLKEAGIQIPGDTQ